MMLRGLSLALTAWACASSGPKHQALSSSRFGIRIENFSFQPPELSISVGDTVVWSNADAFTHTSTSDSAAWSSPNLARGDRFEFVAQAPGRFAYHCAAHPVMHGTLVVRGKSGNHH